MRAKTILLMAMCIFPVVGSAAIAQEPQGGKAATLKSDLAQERAEFDAEIGRLRNQLDTAKSALLYLPPNASKQGLNLKIAELEGELKGKLLSQKNKQQPDGGKAPTELKKPALPSLEEAMEIALKHNGEILFAEAKVREAEAELNNVQQQVLGKIMETEADLKLARAIHATTEKRFETVKRLLNSSPPKNGVSDLDLDEAAVAVTKYKGDVARYEAKLNVLMGKLPLANKPANSSREPPAVLKTYLYTGGNPADMAKVLTDLYKESPAIRVTAMGKAQIVVYAPAAVQDDIAKLIETRNRNQDLVQNPLVAPLLQGKKANLFRTMDLPIKVDFGAWQVKDTVEVLSEQIKDKSNGINLFLAPGKNNDQEKMPAITLPEPITLAATLQLIEDMSNIRFIVRDYGIVGVAANEIPPGAVLLSEVLKGMPITMGGGKKKG
jgi:hypothetical protein